MRCGVARTMAGVAAVVALATATGTARAVEHEHALGVEAGAAMFAVADKGSPDVGGGAGLHYTYGLSDAFNLVADAGWWLVALNEKLTDPSTPHTRPTNVTTVNAGVAYVLDVLRWVPWGALEAGGYALDGGTLDGLKVLPGFALAVGLDYRLNRSWSAGVTLRQHMLFTDASTYPSFTQALLRFQYVWGW
jgi:hypothetical protein